VSATRRSGGFSLPEAILALGLLAGVLISLSGLFVQADGMMRAGKLQTEALAVARNIVEDTDAWHFRALYERFGLDGSAASYTIDSRTNPAAATWQSDLDRELPQAHAEIRLESIVGSGTPPPLDAARAIRITVDVQWRERRKDRSVRVATVRM
jgi:type II secretory pathway component PulJ